MQKKKKKKLSEGGEGISGKRWRDSTRFYVRLCFSK